MESTRHYDTYQEVQRLKQGGFAEDQSVAIVQAVLNLIRVNVATKEDLAHVRNELKSDTAAPREGLKADIAALDKRVNALDKKVDVLAERVAGVGERIDSLSGVIHRIVLPLLAGQLIATLSLVFKLFV